VIPFQESELIQVYRRTIRPLYAYVSKRVGGDVGLAEDLVQETWMRALDNWPRKGMPDDPLAWLLRVARNTLVSYYRSQRPQVTDPTILDIGTSQPPGNPEAATLVGWGMARLRRSHADVLEDFYFEGKSVREIAAERSLSERAVEGRLRRARIKLRKKLDRLLRQSATSGNPIREGGAEDARPTRTP
jgi:RNA polymerase sigma factor (sigma-70 family)